LATRKTAKDRAQVQPTEGPKHAFGAALRDCRKSAGFSQEQLAEAAGLDRSFISLVERGIQSPNIVILLRIAEVLGVAASELMARTECALGLSPADPTATRNRPMARKRRNREIADAPT
jgi:transcriptional regulator with XRE-family HTH domain